MENMKNVKTKSVFTPFNNTLAKSFNNILYQI